MHIKLAMEGSDVLKQLSVARDIKFVDIIAEVEKKCDMKLVWIHTH